MGVRQKGACTIKKAEPMTALPKGFVIFGDQSNWARAKGWADNLIIHLGF